MADSSVHVIETGLQKEDVDFLIPHQANIRIMEASRQRLELPEEKCLKPLKSMEIHHHLLFQSPWLKRLKQEKLKMMMSL